MLFFQVLSLPNSLGCSNKNQSFALSFSYRHVQRRTQPTEAMDSKVCPDGMPQLILQEPWVRMIWMDQKKRGKPVVFGGFFWCYCWWFGRNPKANHLTCLKPCKGWDKTTNLNWWVNAGCVPQLQYYKGITLDLPPTGCWRKWKGEGLVWEA